jgi:hypothetical protein
MDGLSSLDAPLLSGEFFAPAGFAPIFVCRTFWTLPASLRVGGQVIILLVFATKLQRGDFNRAKAAVEKNTGVARRPAFSRFAAGAILPSSAVSDRQAGFQPEFSSRVAAWPSAYPLLPSTHYRMARHLWRGAARAIRPGGLKTDLKTDLAPDGASARATLARGRVMPARVPHGQQNDHRRLPPRRNAGGGATRQ